ncbi:MAG: hypothetical protein DHS20C17_29360 [Cyclobacteriaceae bacterium]|nr:MAG: hypothetical protein DHS20C17_29360 [Cyclobacteriaceae bacterium]
MKTLLISLFLLTGIAGKLTAQEITLKIDQDPLVLNVGETKKLNIIAVDKHGEALEGGSYTYQMLRQEGFVPTSGAQVDSLGNVTGRTPGIYNLIVFRMDPANQSFAKKYVSVQVAHQSTAKVELLDFPEMIYSGTSFPLNVQVTDKSGHPVADQQVSISLTDPSIARVDALNNFYAEKPGSADLSVSSDGITNTVNFKVLKNPVIRLSMDASALVSKSRTGDVLSFNATPYDKSGNVVEIPVLYTVSSRVSEKGAGASGMIDADGRFVAEKPGTYTILATCGNVSTTANVQIEPRNVKRKIELVGQGQVSSEHTSDLWVWEGIDGRDYCVTGTWGSNGFAYFWDVTNPGVIKLIDSIQVDARTVNDVKVSEDGTICIISREGASNRRNGIVILDVKDPSDVKIISTYDQLLTGGVHNLFISKGHVYALSNGQRYDVINIEDPANPYKVGQFQLENPARAIHDVWIEDGIAYSSNWSDGIVIVDVGNGIANGSPENPVEVARSKVSGDANHAAFPYKSESTGKFYVIAGDEIFPLTFNPGTVTIPSGYLHFIDFSDLENPKEVARYELPEAGSHNFWIEDDLLYVAYYNGGLRVVDLSGDLMGDLYKQGREVAHYLPLDSQGYIPNAAMTWGAQPHKGHIFLSDHNSGLWSVKLSGEAPEGTQIEAK